MEHSIGLTIRTLSNLLKRRMFETHPSPGGPPPTKMHAEIIDFLYQNRESVIFQRDLEAHFHSAFHRLRAFAADGGTGHCVS